MRILEKVEFMIDQTAKPAVSDLYDPYQGLSHQTFIAKNFRQISLAADDRSEFFSLIMARYMHSATHKSQVTQAHVQSDKSFKCSL